MLETLLPGWKPTGFGLLNILPTDADDSITVKDQGTLNLNLTRAPGSAAKVLTDANFGKCMSFTGVGGFMSPAVALPINTDFTLSMDVRTRDRRDAVLVTHVTWTSGGTSFGIMLLTDGRVQVYISGAQRLWSSAVPLNTTVNIKLVCVNKVFTLYLNGVAQGSSVSVPGFNEQAYRIGVGSAFEGNNGFNGMIKNLLIVSP